MKFHLGLDCQTRGSFHSDVEIAVKSKIPPFAQIAGRQADAGAGQETNFLGFLRYREEQQISTINDRTQSFFT